MFFLLFKRNNKEKSLRVILFYILFCIINDALIFYLHEIHSRNQFILFALFTVAEFTFFCVFYYYTMPSGWLKKALLPVWGIFFIFSCIDFFLVNQMNAFDSIAIGVEDILIILMCIYYLVVQIKRTNDLHVYSTSNFWIIITFLIYLSGTFFLYIMAENMINDKNFRIQYTIINSAFYILKNILLSVAMLMKTAPEVSVVPKNNDWDDLLSYKLKN